jgi:hypothetical protein
MLVTGSDLLLTQPAVNQTYEMIQMLYPVANG